MWDLIVSVPDHCFSFYFKNRQYILTMVAQLIFDLKSIDFTPKNNLCQSSCTTVHNIEIDVTGCG